MPEKIRPEIKEIKQFFQWVSEGSSTYANCKELFNIAGKGFRTDEIWKLLAALKFKCGNFKRKSHGGLGNEDGHAGHAPG